MKNKFCILLIAVSLFAACFNVSAVYVSGGGFDALPENWTTEQNGNAALSFVKYKDTAEKEMQSMLLKCDTSGGAASANISVTTELYEPGGAFVLSMVMAVNSARANTGVYIVDENGESENLFMITQGIMRAFGKNESRTTVDNNKFTGIDLAVDPENGRAVLWINGEKKYETDDIGIAAEKFAKFKVRMYNGYTNRQLTSDWHIADFELASSGAYEVSSMPKNGSSFVDAQSLKNITLDFGAVMVSGCFEGSNAKLTKQPENAAEQETEASFKRKGSRLIVTSAEGFEPSTLYKLRIETLTDIFGNEYEAYEMFFTTAPDGYMPTTAKIISPKNGANTPLDYKIDVSAEITQGSADFEKAELIANGAVAGTITQMPCEFEFIPKTGSRQSLTVRVYDSMGGITDSGEVVINTFENKAPEVEINIKDGDTAEPGTEIIYTASDIDGKVEYVEFSLNGEVLAASVEPQGMFTLPENVPFGRGNIKVTAYDEYEKAGSASAEAVISLQGETIIANGTFSEYTSGSSYNGFSLVPNGGPHSIKAGAFEGEKCIVFEASDLSDNKDNPADGTCYANYFVSDTAMKQFKMTLRVYIATKQTDSHIIIRSNDSPAVFIEDIKFNQGNFEYANGSSVNKVPFEPGWFDIVCDVNLENSTYSLSLNGNQLAKNYSFSKSITSLSAVRFDMYNKQEGAASIGIGKFTVSQKYTYPYFESAEFSGGLAASELIIKTGSKIDTSIFNFYEGFLLCEGNPVEIEGLSVGGDGQSVIFKLKYPVEASCEYTALAKYAANKNNYEISALVTAPYDESMGVVNARFITGTSNIAFSADFVNNTADDKDALVIFAEYDESGVMVNCISQSAVVNGEVNITTSGLNYDSSHKYKAYIRDSWASLKPINIKVYEY